MAFIPRDAKWYIAYLVVAISVGKRRKATVHINTVLIRADGPVDAYKKALARGKLEELQYDNELGAQVRLRFLGLQDLNVIHEELEHGAELSFHEKLGQTTSQMRKLVTKRPNLAVFRPRGPRRTGNDTNGDLPKALRRAAAKGPRNS